MHNRELTLQEIQQGSFRVLLKFKEICEALNLEYFLTYGTLLGAVRHSGFIPWDDDIDVWMMREDYEKFLAYCRENKEILGNYQLLNYRNTKNYPYPISRFSDVNYYVDYNNIKNYGLGLFIDLYPLDYVDPNDASFQRKQNRKIRIISRLFDNKGEVKHLLSKAFAYLSMFFSFCFSRKRYIESVDRAAQKYNDDKHEYLSVCCWEFDSCLDKFEDIAGQKRYLSFNGEKFQVPNNYDAILKHYYGDYMKMPPKNERVAHHFYRVFFKVD